MVDMALWNSKSGDKKQQFCTCMDHGGLTIFVRARPWHETAFVQVLLPVALSYETFVCKLCVALDIDRALVKKVLKIPDVLVRTTEDVIRLKADDRLELVLHSSFWKYHVTKRVQTLKPFVTFALLALLLAMTSAVALHQKEILSQLQSIRREFVDNSCHIPMSSLHRAYDRASSGEDDALDKRLKIFETILLNRLSDLERKLEHFLKATNDKSSGSSLPTLHFQTMQDLIEQLQQLKSLLRRKMKLKEDEW